MMIGNNGWMQRVVVGIFWGAIVSIAGAEVVINEFMAVNSTLTDVRPTPAVNIYTLIDGEPVYADWIELYNDSSSPIDLEGWVLTDNPDDPFKWLFPAGASISAHGYLRVWASNKDEDKYGYPFVDDQGDWHTNFELSRSGEYLALVRPDGVVEQEYNDYPRQCGLVSYGMDTGGLEGYLNEVTPKAANSGRYSGWVEPVQFDRDHGFFERSFNLTLSCDTSGAQIRYTLDQSLPTATHGTVYSGPIQIEQTTCVRAVAIKENWLSSEVTTQTYLFLEEIVTQATHATNGSQVTPSGYPNRWTGTDGDYQVDPDITDPDGLFGDVYAAGFIDDLRDIPSISVVAPIDDLFGSTGIYVNQSQDGTERAGSVELLDPNGLESFTLNCGVRMQGGASDVEGGTTLNRWKCKKLSLRLMFRGFYGGRLDHAVFGSDAADAFDTLVLDSRPQNSWLHSDPIQRMRGEYVRDQVASNTQLALGSTACHGRPFHLYLNGLYWGLYWMHERPDAAFAASYLGGNKDDYDVIKHVWYNAIDGDNSDYLAMFDISPTSPDPVTAFERLQAKLDVPDFIDYMITNYYLGNGDWDHKNWYATHNRFDPNGRWRWHMWDGEHVMGTDKPESSWFARPDNTGYRITSRAPTGLHWDWIDNDEYRLLFADRVYQHCFNDGPLTPENFTTLFNDLTDQIDRAIVGESARWGDYRRSVPYTRDLDWLTECNRLRTDFIPGRRDLVLAQFMGIAGDYPKNPAWYPDIDPPDFMIDGVVQHGGQVALDAQLSVNPKVYTVVLMTQDGTDPRLPGGAVNSDSVEVYVRPITLTHSVTIKARTYTSGGQWSPLHAATYGVTPVTDNLRITELMYHPAVDDTEFIELQNIGNQTLELTNVRLTRGVDFDFTGWALAPGEVMVIVEDEAAFAAQYPYFSGILAGTYSGRLSNGGETLELRDALDQVVQSFAYEDDWIPSTDGDGYSLVVVDPTGPLDDWNRALGWQASSNVGGSPGVVD